MMLEHGKESRLVPDYVLGLLPAETAEAVESHLTTCERCREAASRERLLLAEVRQTVTSATRPVPGRIRRLMPAPPARHTFLPALNSGAWQPLAALALLVVLFLGVVQRDLFLGQPASDSILSSPSATSLIATATPTPTATQATEPAQTQTYRANYPVLSNLVMSPDPAGTPLAALPPAQLNNKQSPSSNP